MGRPPIESTNAEFLHTFYLFWSFSIDDRLPSSEGKKKGGLGADARARLRGLSGRFAICSSFGIWREAQTKAASVGLPLCAFRLLRPAGPFPPTWRQIGLFSDPLMGFLYVRPFFLPFFLCQCTRAATNSLFWRQVGSSFFCESGAKLMRLRGPRVCASAEGEGFPLLFSLRSAVRGPHMLRVTPRPSLSCPRSFYVHGMQPMNDDKKGIGQSHMRRDTRKKGRAVCRLQPKTPTCTQQRRPFFLDPTTLPTRDADENKKDTKGER